MLNPELLHAGSRKELIADHTGKQTKWADVHCQLLLFPEEQMPSRRACGIHATLALEHAQEEQWLEPANCSLSEEDLCVDDAAWSSPTFDRGRISTFLEDSSAAARSGTPGIYRA